LLRNVENLLCCPVTGNRLELDKSLKYYRTVDADIRYPVVDGIIDFMPGQVYGNARAYDIVVSLYESIITNRNLPYKILNRMVWGNYNNKLYYDIIPGYIPTDFKGIILDVPAGTGVFTVLKYKGLAEATVIAVDYSMRMLQKARRRLVEIGADNVILVHADVTRLPLLESSIDRVFSMNGLHAIKPKEKAIEEINRVLKPGGRFSGNFYTTGQRALTDFFIRYVYSAGGWFARPFYSPHKAIKLLESRFKIVKCRNEGPMFLFDTRK
jgi:SAM-dependent methyltransferase